MGEEDGKVSEEEGVFGKYFESTLTVLLHYSSPHSLYIDLTYLLEGIYILFNSC